VLGILTPPVGTGLFIAATLAQVRPGRIFIALAPFLLVTIAVLILLCWQPWLVTGVLD
jgi:TRAP-type C4-dicarboxylate transport system permease large subunit